MRITVPASENGRVGSRLLRVTRSLQGILVPRRGDIIYADRRKSFTSSGITTPANPLLPGRPGRLALAGTAWLLRDLISSILERRIFDPNSWLECSISNRVTAIKGRKKPVWNIERQQSFDTFQGHIRAVTSANCARLSRRVPSYHDDESP
jgi:hypothetical protein